jgi:transposase
MGRPASGKDVLGSAKDLLKKARTAEELRQAQAVLLPLEFGFSMEQVAGIIGVSRGWACQLRIQFIRSGSTKAERKRQQGGRRRENMSRQEEEAFLAPFLEQAATGGILVVGEIKKALDNRLGRKTALASTYNLLHRHNWRKLAPDKRHPKSDVVVQEEWKKNSRKSSP